MEESTTGQGGEEEEEEEEEDEEERETLRSTAAPWTEGHKVFMRRSSKVALPPKLREAMFGSVESGRLKQKCVCLHGTKPNNTWR